MPKLYCIILKMTTLKTINRTWLVWEWLLDWTALDTSGNWNNWTATNVTYTWTDRGYQSQCGVFNGSWSYITCPSINSSIVSTNRLTINCWVNAVNYAWTDNTRYIVSERQQSWSFYIDFDLRINNTTNIASFRTAWASNVWLIELSSINPFNTWIWNMITAIYDWSYLYIYKNWILDNSIAQSTPFATQSSQNLMIWRSYWWISWDDWDWNIGWLRIFNRVLSQQEIQTLYQEWLKQLSGRWEWSLWDWLVSQWQNNLDNTLFDSINWTTATLVWWTATTDLFWVNNAISNPSYTWSSITYTTWYTFENDWTWWAIKTNPTWLSATWINRTTTLWKIFLFNRTLSTSEVTNLQNICLKFYTSPTYKTLPKNLQDWMILWQAWDYSWTTAYDVSWNWNNWTLTNSPTPIRKYQHKWFSYNGSTQNISVPYSSAFNTNNLSCWWFINLSSISNTSNHLIIWRDSWSTGTRFFQLSVLQASGTIDFIVWNTSDTIFQFNPSVTLTAWKTYHVFVTVNWNAVNIYLNWVNIMSSTFTWTLKTGTSIWIWIWWISGSYLKWQIFNPVLYNRTLAPQEVQQLYISQFIK